MPAAFPDCDVAVTSQSCDWVCTLYEMVCTRHVLVCSSYVRQNIIHSLGRDLCYHPCYCPDLQVVAVHLAIACLHHAAFLETCLYNFSTFSLHTNMYSVRTQYLLNTYQVHTSMYSVHTQYILSTGLCPLHSDAAVLLLSLLVLPSTNSVHTWFAML
jgi:hypothetical protein